MVLYNVTIKVEPASNDEWVKWMKEEHIPELLELGVFEHARLMKLHEVDETDGITYAAQYTCKSMDEYNKYISDHAATMRERGIARFKDKFVAFRTIMEEI